jgi:cell division septation protein DedD
MPIMLTFRAGRIAVLALLAALAGGCSREQQDWRSAEAADTREAYGRFLEQHPDSELATQARTRVEQLTEESDWAHAAQLATAEGYREFLSQHPTGKWAEEARIRIEAYALGSAPHLAARADTAAAVPATTPPGGGVRALAMATSATPPPIRSAAPPSGLAQLVVAPQRTMRAPAVASAIAATPAGASPVAAAGGAYAVQLGAFGSEASADREWHRLQGRFNTQLGGLAPRIVLASGTGGQLYRLQAPAAGEAQARALCASLREQAQPCVPVLPQ